MARNSAVVEGGFDMSLTPTATIGFLYSTTASSLTRRPPIPSGPLPHSISSPVFQSDFHHSNKAQGFLAPLLLFGISDGFQKVFAATVLQTRAVSVAPRSGREPMGN